MTKIKSQLNHTFYAVTVINTLFKELSQLFMAVVFVSISENNDQITDVNHN